MIAKRILNITVLLGLFAAKVVMGSTANAEVTAAETPAAVAWRGTIHMGGNDVVVVLHVTESADHSFTARMDIPNAGRKDVAIDEFRRVGDDIQLSIKNLVNFDGKLSEAGDSFSGVWKQAGNSFSATFHKSIGEPDTTLVRPQEPKRPYPYREEEVAVEQKCDGLKLSGTLTLPSLAAESAKAPYPAVLLVTGSGPQDRDETVAGHRPFLIIADFLTRRGIAVLRVDDRGVRKSTGDFNRADPSDFTQDALACIEYLAARQDIDPKRIGIIGHSEGATVASILVSRSSQVAFIVMLAGPGLPGDQLAYSQSAAMLRAEGANEEQIASNRKVQEKVIAVLKSEKDPAAAERKLREVLRTAFNALPDAQQKAMGDVNPQINAEIKRLLSPESRFGIEYDPATTLKKVTCPVLAIDGEKDVVVVASENLPRIEAALKSGGNIHYKIQSLPHLNHLFQHCATGSVSEYDKIEETFSPAALEIIGTWVQQQTNERTRK